MLAKTGVDNGFASFCWRKRPLTTDLPHFVGENGGSQRICLILLAATNVILASLARGSGGLGATRGGSFPGIPGIPGIPGQGSGGVPLLEIHCKVASSHRNQFVSRLLRKTKKNPIASHPHPCQKSSVKHTESGNPPKTSVDNGFALFCWRKRPLTTDLPHFVGENVR